MYDRRPESCRCERWLPADCGPSPPGGHEREHLRYASTADPVRAAREVVSPGMVCLERPDALLFQDMPALSPRDVAREPPRASPARPCRGGSAIL